MEVVKMKNQKEDKFGMALLGVVHLVCCVLLLVLLAGGISMV
jgi:hypothetical protein